MFVHKPYSAPKYLEKRVHPRQRALYREAGKIEGDIAKHLLKALKGLQGRVPLTELARVIPRASLDEIFSVVGSDGIEIAASAITEELAGGIIAGATTAAKEAGKVVVLDMLEPNVQKWLKEHTSELVKGISKTSRAALKRTLQEGIARGRHPARMARDLKRVLGLTERQGAALSKYWGALEKQGVPLDKIERRVQRYADRQLKYRAQTIARTESMTAVNRGRLQLWDQLVEDGALAETTAQEWLTSDDERVCPICAPLDGTKAKLGETFEGGFEAPPAHPNCRCTTVLVEHPRRKC